MAKQKDQNPVPTNAFNDVIVGWIAPEHLRYERGTWWFIGLFLVSAALVAYGYWSGSLTMMVLFVVMPLVLLLEHQRKPRAVEVIFSHYGVKFGVLELPYSSIKSFAVLHRPPHTDELHLMTKRKSHPEVVVPLMGMNPSLIRNFLMTQLPEMEGKKLSFADMLVRILRLN